MSKRLTISNRWRNWTFKEPVWAYSCLACFGLVFVGLMIHIGILNGLWRTVGLYTLIVGDVGCLAITTIRGQYWWLGFFAYLTVGVIVFEITSYFFGGA